MTEDLKDDQNTEGEAGGWLPDMSEDREIFIEFVKEAKFRVEDIESAIMELENDPDDSELINRMLRQFHSIKGGAGLLGISPVSKLGHDVETFLEEARDGKMSVSREFIDFLFSSLDTMKLLVQKVSDELDARC